MISAALLRDPSSVQGIERMVAEVCLGKVGAVCACEVSRFARNSRDWQQLIEMCGVVDTVLVDQETVYAPRHGDDRLTQPAFSRRIRSLEHWLGTALIDRSAFPVVLTQQGEEFLPAAQEMIAAAIGARQDFRLANQAVKQQVRIFTLHVLALHLVPALVEPFLTAEPRASVEIVPNLPGTEFYFDALASGLAHIVIAYAQQAPPQRTADLVVARIASDEFIPVASPALIAATPGLATLQTVSILALLYWPFSFSHNHIAPTLRRLGQRVVTRAISPLGETLRSIALRGLGVAWLPRHAIQEELADGRLGPLVDPDNPPIPVEIVGWRRRDLAEDTALRHFFETFRGG